MLRYVPAVLGLAALSTALVSLTGCADEERVRVRAPRREYVVVEQPRQVVVQQPQREVIFEQPRAEVVVAQPRIVETVSTPRVEVVEMEAPPVAHVRAAPSVIYEGHPVYWYQNRWYYQNGGRWGYYQNEPIGLRSRRYVIR
jgi:hypothetical protein